MDLLILDCNNYWWTCWTDPTLKEVELKIVFQKFLADEFGATAIEYGLIAAGIAIAIITAVKGVGTQLSTNFDTIKTKLATP